MKPAFPKHSSIRKRKPAVKKHADGREVCLKSAAGRAELAKRRRDVYERDNGICWLCGKFVHWDDYQLEHKTPKGHGGATHDDRMENLAVAHSRCNFLKGSRRVESHV